LEHEAGDSGLKGTSLGMATLIGFISLFGVGMLLDQVVDGVVEGIFDGNANAQVFLGITLATAIKLVIQLLLAAIAMRVVLGHKLEHEIHHHWVSWWEDLLGGAGFASLAVVVLFLIMRVMGWLEVKGLAWNELGTDGWLRALWLSILSVSLVAVVEEVVVRGFLLAGVEKAWGRWLGLLVMALCFAGTLVAEGGWEEAGGLWGVTLRTLPALLLGWIILHTDSPFLPTGVHFAWVVLQEDFFNLAGEESPRLFGLVTELRAPTWFVAEKHGIEAGLAGVLGLAIIWTLVWVRARSVRHEQYAH